MLFPVQIEEALNLSLDCLKTQIAEKGNHYLNSSNGKDIWDSNTLFVSGMSRISLYKIQPDTILLLQQRYGHTNNPKDFLLPSESLIRQRTGYGTSSQIVRYDNQDWFYLYRYENDSTLLLLQYPVDQKLSKARERIETALSMANTLALFKESILKKNLIWILAALMITGLMGLTWIVSRRLSRGMTVSMQALVTGMEQVAEGNLTYQITCKGKDEFQFLIDQFNKMILDLKTTRDRLLTAERLAAWQTIARQISHEIKNSLTPIAISIHRMKPQLSDASPKVREGILTIEEEMAMLQNMAAEFSDFSRMPEPVMSPIHLNDLIQSAVNLFRNTVGSIKFHLNLEPELLPIDADRDQIKRVLNNLIKNAVESIGKNGDIWIETGLTREDHQIEFNIRDTGTGMDAETLERLFEPYYTTKQRGTGLGMTMVKKIIDAHQGIIHIDSTPGKGTTIKILLPQSFHSELRSL